jgi:hypothetical protein
MIMYVFALPVVFVYSVVATPFFLYLYRWSHV